MERGTAGQELERFEALPLDAKLREIWLGGRETNGSVARALREIEEGRLARQEIVFRVTRLERYWTQMTAIGAFVVLVVAPAMMALIDVLMRALLRA